MRIAALPEAAGREAFHRPNGNERSCGKRSRERLGVFLGHILPKRGHPLDWLEQHPQVEAARSYYRSKPLLNDVKVELLTAAPLNQPFVHEHAETESLESKH